MTRQILSIIALVATSVTASAQQNLAERLGYPKDAKLVIIHADDLGLSYSENKASTYAMEKGSVSSASIMVPCPWFTEIAAYAQENPQKDFGLHLTLTSEWKYFKFGPVAAKENVPGLINKRGFFYESVDSVVRHAKPEEVEIELRAQIERARQFGIDVTHLDSHMGTLFMRPEFMATYLKMGREFQLPVLLTRQIAQAYQRLLTPKDVVLDTIMMAYPQHYKEGMDKFYTGVLKAVKPGVSVILLHAAYDDREMRGITIDHPDYGAGWRQADFNFFTSDQCRKLLAENKIQLVTWRDVRDKILRKQ
jgi:chitin disaccharide deacetylase